MKMKKETLTEQPSSVKHVLNNVAVGVVAVLLIILLLWIVRRNRKMRNME